MKIAVPHRELYTCFSNLNCFLKQTFDKPEIRFINIGTKRVRIENYSAELSSVMERQLTYLLDTTEQKPENRYDCTLVLWKTDNIENLYNQLFSCYPPPTANLPRFRVEKLIAKKYNRSTVIDIRDASENGKTSFLSFSFGIDSLEGYCKESNVYYYSVCDTRPEEIIKNGHFCVKLFNKIAESPNTTLVHGACIGIRDKGILFCARGNRGKSTLTVLSLLDGFDYVSDDYLILEKQRNTGNGFFAYPIYSIITLSPDMYNKMYNRLSGSRFISNNSRKDKYVINISNLHDRFRVKYPVRLCMFPEIDYSISEPEIHPSSENEKNRAIAQIVHSTVIQMESGKWQNSKALKILSYFDDCPFYTIRLCTDIQKNVEYLKKFISNY